MITELLAPDSAGTPSALARRMGIEEIIWDCSYWAAGMTEFRRYSACFNKHGQLRRKVDRTTAHRNHVHFGMTKLGAAGRTTFWRYLKLGSADRVRDELASRLPLVAPPDPPQTQDGDDPGWDQAQPEEDDWSDGW